MRLVCFPAAGGTTVQFFAWPEVLPGEVEVHVAQLPGRERRRHEAPMAEAEALIGELTAAIAPLDDRPLAFYGHSMGALLAFEVARRLQIDRDRAPVHLFVAARRAPHLPWPYVPTGPLTDGEFARELQERWGALPRSIAENPELLSYFLPVIRADIALLETYRYRHAESLCCPITVYGGQKDPSTTPDDLDAWRAQTNAGFRLRIFDGDHFFPQSLRGPLLADIAGCLARNGMQHA